MAIYIKTKAPAEPTGGPTEPQPDSEAIPPPIKTVNAPSEAPVPQKKAGGLLVFKQPVIKGIDYPSKGVTQLSPLEHALKYYIKDAFDTDGEALLDNAFTPLTKTENDGPVVTVSLELDPYDHSYKYTAHISGSTVSVLAPKQFIEDMEADDKLNYLISKMSYHLETAVYEAVKKVLSLG